MIPVLTLTSLYCDHLPMQRKCAYAIYQIYHDLDDPSRTLSYNQGRKIVRQLVAGFRAAGLKKGECFSITAFNDVPSPTLLVRYTY